MDEQPTLMAKAGQINLGLITFKAQMAEGIESVLIHSLKNNANDVILQQI